MEAPIPVIDIGRLDSPATRAAIDRACRDWGFFQIVGHGLDGALADRIMAASRAFFAQPAALKRRLLRDAENPWGYYDQELTKNRRDWKEIYDHGPSDGQRLAPRWPEAPLRETFEPAVRAYHGACTTLARRLLAAMAVNLGAPPQALLHGFGDRHASFLRLNHYPPRPDPSGTGPAVLGVGEHTDSGALTLLLQDAQPGLEVQRDGRWHAVPPLAGALVVNIGDIVQVWSNDLYTAAVHRAVVDPLHDRYSVPFFFNPSYDTDYEPLPGAVTPERPARYRRIRWGEFRALRAAGDYADLGVEVQISHYRHQEH